MLMSPTLDLDCLRALVAVVEEGGFTAAAARLNRTQSAVSMQIRRLEDQLGQRLLARDRKPVGATPVGSDLLGYARRMLALNDDAMASLAATGLAGRLRLGTPDDYALTLLPPLIARFAASHPRVEIEIVCGMSNDLEHRVQTGRLDIALLTRRPGSPPGDLLRREQLVWVAAADHRPEWLDPLPLALFPEDCTFRPLTTAALDRAGRAWRVAYTAASITGVLSAVASGLAITPLAAATVPPGYRRLGPAEGLPPLPVIEIALRRAEGAGPAARLLADQLLDSLRATDRAA